MKLNIETDNPLRTLATVRTVFCGQKVSMTKAYGKTADYQIGNEDGKSVYSLDGLLELATSIPSFKIRIY